MNLGLSNFAYSNLQDENVYRLLKESDVSYVEIVIPNLLPGYVYDKQLIDNYSSILNRYNLKVYSAQSLFYQVDCSTLSDVPTVLDHLRNLIRYSVELGIKVLVLGSPSLRKIEVNYIETLHHLFSQVDDLLNGTGVELMIEPNASVYKGGYFYTLGEIVKFLQAKKYRNIYTMLDTHNSELEGIDPVLDFIKYSPYIKHIHVSEIELKPITVSEKHTLLGETLREFKYTGGITYEVKPHTTLRESLNLFKKYYK